MNKITKEFLESEIQEVKYTQMGDRLTHCLIITKSGFLFSGESVVVDAANFNKELGEKYAYDQAFNSMWQPYGFWLHQKLNKNKSQGIERTKEWFEKVRPEPTLDNFIAQYSVLLEEVSESLEALGLPYMELLETTKDLREGNYTEFLQDTFYNVEPKHKRIEFLDAMCDVVVTAVGSAYMLNQDIVKALDDVNESNWSKFDENGNPIFNDFGKVLKGPNYREPNLESFV